MITLWMANEEKKWMDGLKEDFKIDSNEEILNQWMKEECQWYRWNLYSNFFYFLKISSKSLLINL